METLSEIRVIVLATMEEEYDPDKYFQPLLDKLVIPLVLIKEGEYVEEVRKTKPPGSKVHGILVTINYPLNFCTA